MSYVLLHMRYVTKEQNHLPTADSLYIAKLLFVSLFAFLVFFYPLKSDNPLPCAGIRSHGP
jgi:hypothetical protein